MRFEPSIKFPYPWRMVTSALWCRLGLRSNSPFQLPPLCLYPHPHQTPHSFQLCSKRAFHTGVLARLSCWDTERDIKVTVLENSRYTLIGPDQTRSSLSALSLLSNQKQQQQQEKAQSEWNLAEQTLVYGIEARSPGGEDLCTVPSYLTPARGGELTLCCPFGLPFSQGEGFVVHNPRINRSFSDPLPFTDRGFSNQQFIFPTLYRFLLTWLKGV